MASGGEEHGAVDPKALAATVPGPQHGERLPDATLSDATLPVVGDASVEATRLAVVDPRHYHQEDELARGGMGVVRRAFDRRLGREVAVKELLGDAPHLLRRFEREARVTGQLQHPGIVPVYEVGRWPDGRPFYAMKLVDGRPLDAVIEETDDDDARLALIPRLLPAIEAMAYAHDQGVIHRDLKPGNVILGEFGETVVIDWGLAKAIDEDGEEPSAPESASHTSSGGLAAARTGGKITIDGSVVGTPAYMPPEQACGDPLDARADVYALGALLYHTLSGRAPYEGTIREVLKALLEGPPPSVDSVAPALPRDLVGIVAKAMAQDRLDRYANAGELARDLQAFSTGRLVGAYHYTSRELFLRFVRRNPALSAALLGMMLIASVGSMLIFRAYRVSEGQRQRAEQAEGRALQEERAAHERLAQMHTNRAVQLLQTQDYLGAELFAAAALVEQPANEASPHHALSNESARTASPSLVAAPGATWAAARALRFAARGRELPAHEDWVYDVLPSSSGRWVATAGADRKVQVWDASMGKLHATLEGHEDTIFQVALSADERQLATSSYDGTVRLWSFPDGAALRTLEHPSDRVYGLCYASDGRVVAVGAGGVLATFDADSGALVDRLDAVSGIPWRLSCSRKTPLALLGSKETEAVVIDTSAMEVMHRLPHPNAAVRGALLTPDERHAITADGDGRLRRFDLQTGELRAEMPTDAPCESLAISADGRRLALGGEAITVVDSASFRAFARLRDHRSQVTALAFDAFGRQLFSGGFDHRVVEWLLADQRAASRFMSPSASPIDSVHLSADGATLVASADDGSITWWDRKGGSLLHRLEAHAGPIRALGELADGRLVTSGVDRMLHVIDPTAREVRHTIELPHFGDEVSLGPDGKTLALGSGDGTVVFYDTASWSAQSTTKVHDGRTWWLGYDPAGKRLGTASFAGTIAILDAADGRVLQRWQGHEARIYDADWRHDGNELLTADFDGWVRAWDPSTAKQRQQWRVLDGERLTGVAYSPDATRILVTSHQGLRVYTPTGELTARIDLGETNAASWTAEGEIVVAIPGEVLILPLEATSWRADPRQLVAEAEAAAATSLRDMMGMLAPLR